MKLAVIQKRMACAIMRPLTRSERMRLRAPDGTPIHRYAAGFIKPNDQLSSYERLEIYNRQYWYRVLASLQEDFPGLRAILGGPRFDQMGKAYVTDCPSRSFTLRNLGSNLEPWLRKHPKWAGRKQRLALDMVRLEWADIEAFDAEARPTFRPDDLSLVTNAEIRLVLQPYVRLLTVHYPVDNLLLAIRQAGDNTGVASNAFAEGRRRTHIPKVNRLPSAKTYLAVHRIDESVYFRRMGCEEFEILASLRKGTTLVKCIARGFRGSKIAADDRPSAIWRWFRHWATLGWFCSTDTSASKVEHHRKDMRSIQK